MENIMYAIDNCWEDTSSTDHIEVLCGDSVGSTGIFGNAGKAATVTAGDDTRIWWWFIVVYSRLSGLSAVIFAQQTRGSADETVATSVQGRTKQSKNNSLHLNPWLGHVIR